ncbi:hypothetical protein ABTW76_05150 [Paenibacillus dendritiformis]
MYYVDLLSFKSIAEQLGVEWWDIKRLFQINELPTFSIAERGKKFRKKIFEEIYDLHHNQKLSIKEIQNKLGFSPPFIRKTLREGGKGEDAK